MRIIAGEYASRKIETPKGNATRPTLDKVREAVFSSLGTYFDGGVFLDLYAGSGANGLEALSRGMDEVIFVDQSRAAIASIKTNIGLLKCAEQTTVLHTKDTVALEKLAAEGRKFDIVYLDPPYEKQKNYQILSFLDDHDMINENGYVIIESLKEETYDQPFVHLKQTKEKIYGISKITYYRRCA